MISVGAWGALRSWKRGVIALGGISLAACASSHPFATTDRWPDAPRKPDGVVVDPMPGPVQPSSHGDTSSLGAVALTSPSSPEDALPVVHDFFDAIARQDLAAFAPLVATPSRWVNPSVGRGPGEDLSAHFSNRFRRLHYAQLAGIAVMRDADTAIDTYETLESPPPGHPTRPPEMHPGDVLIRVHILSPRIGAERLFGDEMLFLMRPVAGRFRIAVLFEEFTLP